MGVVYAQDPAAGQKIDKGAQVTLTYNKGKGQVDLPSLVGQPIAAANATLAQLGLTAQPTDAESDQPVGTVLTQDPVPGKVDAGSVVKLTVSKGKGQVAVPNVGGLDVVDRHVPALERRPRRHAGAGGERAASRPATPSAPIRPPARPSTRAPA